ncbi:hypothetical protein TREMEDRAFT_63454 [Tremella mesenterica DSM 1558]|uniref:uncharacterized protein n=1 Tax=Tremella mesenterica (strain ATCC 24925 / CBS 8224 / DSM 1558 / NBRC 9311 / NRRL Y-6157 / RJB 2259-6 / UBC 559-6) TaxID=578456 RepID=UPI0003F49CF4|nr:uncharacterized protein TREMEDRAFT_63454 [Tremella mesenterica DSM 1558]EIW68282.1 hypothetical protein TREMEDRAFT_63454 [Tremella mesenterica DSM 1558]
MAEADEIKPQPMELKSIEKGMIVDLTGETEDEEMDIEMTEKKLNSPITLNKIPRKESISNHLSSIPSHSESGVRTNQSETEMIGREENTPLGKSRKLPLTPTSGSDEGRVKRIKTEGTGMGIGMEVKRGEWTDTEDRALWQAQLQHGEWKNPNEVVERVTWAGEGRSVQECKQRWAVLKAASGL